MFPVALPVFTRPEGDDAPLALGGPFARMRRDRGLEPGLVTAARLVVVAAPWAAEHPVNLVDGMALAAHLHDLPRLFACWRKMWVAFFKIAFPSVKRPLSRSNAATRALFWLVRWPGGSKMEAIRARKMAFPSASTDEASWCARLNSALLLAPVNNSRTTRALHSG